MLKSMFAHAKNKLRVMVQPQGMPKYQSFYLGGNANRNHHLELNMHSGKREVEVLNCWYEPSLACYVYSVQYKGSEDRLPVPEKYLKEVRNVS